MFFDDLLGLVAVGVVTTHGKALLALPTRLTRGNEAVAGGRLGIGISTGTVAVSVVHKNIIT